MKVADKAKQGIRVVINDGKTGNSFQREVAKEVEGALAGRKIGDSFDGGIVGLPGYKLVVTGGSDNAGFPMRAETPGQKRVKVVIATGAGVKHPPHGSKLKKLVSGNTIGALTAQVNAKIAEAGPQKLEELGFTPKVKEGKAPKEPKAPKPAEAAAKEEKKPEAKESKPEAKAEQKAEAKPEQKAEAKK